LNNNKNFLEAKTWLLKGRYDAPIERLSDSMIVDVRRKVVIGGKKKKAELEVDAELDNVENNADLAETAELDEAVALDENGDEITDAPELDDLQQAQAEVGELNDKLLRMQAEMENLRKRTRREVADAHKFGVEKFATSLLDVVDNLERALEVEEGNEEAVREGIQLTLNSWHDMMKRFEVARIDAVGSDFDPHRHEALTQMPSDEPEGTVIAQHVAGYTLHGRLIRAAKVLVSSGPAS